MTTTHRCSVCRAEPPHAELKMDRTHFDTEDGASLEDVPMVVGLGRDCIGKLAAGRDLDVTENVYE